ncbi:MAG: alpha/beta hydrolase [Dehalococcoidia bacterium]|nr:alpha/beta hydrolase [Dehalococcoidia bacterium]
MDPRLAELLPAIEADTAGRLASLERDVAAVRRLRDEQALGTQGTGAPVALQEDRTIPGPAGPVPVRLFLPERPAGAYLHIHGGGWVLGSERNQDPMLRGVAAEAGVAVLSVGYRLAPENPYPAGLDDCLAASRWLAAHAAELGVADPAALAIGGESAGANLATATLLRRRDEMDDPPYRAAVLTYGVFSAVYDLPSMKAMWDRKLVLSGPIMEFFSRAYAGGRDLRHPYISPLYADLRGLPPAIFSVGTLDHLYSDTLLMAQAWQAAGNAGVLHEYKDGPHGFNLFPLAIARASNERVTAFLAERVGRGAALPAH